MVGLEKTSTLKDGKLVPDKYLVLTTGYPPNRVFSVVETDDGGYLSRRERLVTFIPDAGTENNAVKTARLLNKEHHELVELRSKQEAEDAPQVRVITQEVRES